MLQFEIQGDAISKKNSVISFKLPNGRSMTTPSKYYKKWHKIAKNALKNVPKWQGGYPVVIELYHYRKTNRAFDFSNMFEGIQDVLQECGIIEEDNMHHVIPKIRGKGWEKDKDNPRMEVKIYAFED
jgi:Holliday junction resolvase RusA-like endonuclease